MRARKSGFNPRADYDLCAAFSEHDRSRLAYSAARSRMRGSLSGNLDVELNVDGVLNFEGTHQSRERFDPDARLPNRVVWPLTRPKLSSTRTSKVTG